MPLPRIFKYDLWPNVMVSGSETHTNKLSTK